MVFNRDGKTGSGVIFVLCHVKFRLTQIDSFNYCAKILKSKPDMKNKWVIQ